MGSLVVTCCGSVFITYLTAISDHNNLDIGYIIDLRIELSLQAPALENVHKHETILLLLTEDISTSH